MSYDLSLNDAALQRVPRGGHPLGRGDPLSKHEYDETPVLLRTSRRRSRVWLLLCGLQAALLLAFALCLADHERLLSAVGSSPAAPSKEEEAPSLTPATGPLTMLNPGPDLLTAEQDASVGLYWTGVAAWTTCPTTLGFVSQASSAMPLYLQGCFGR